MGLFSGSNKYVAYAASSSLFDQSPHSLKAAILSSTIEGGSKSDAIRYTINTDQFARAKSMFRYAAKYDDPTREGGYVRGLPTSNMSVITVHPNAVSDALGRAVGAFDSISSTLSGPGVESFFLSALVQADWPEWDENDEEVILPDGTLAPNPPEFSRVSDVEWDEEGPFRPPLYTGKYIATWTSSSGDYVLDLDVGPFLPNLYVQVKYLIGERTHYWYYEVGSNVDPILEAAIEEESQSAEFLPVAILMKDEVWFDEADRDGTPAPDTELAITTNKLLKKLATSGTEIKEDFITQEEEDNASGDKNKSNAKKWDFFVHYAVPVDTNVRGAKEYLWFFYENLRDWSTHTSDDYYDYLASQSGDRYGKAQPISELNITEGDVDGYNVNYRWSFIETREFDGEFLIDDVNADVTPRPLKPKEIHNEQFQRTDVPGEQEPEYQSKLNDFFGEVVPIGLYDPKHKKNADNKDWERYGYHDYVLLTRAMVVPEGDPPKYEQTLIMGLSMQYVINTKDTNESKKGYRFRYATPHMFGLDEETAEFRIPMQWGALKKVPTLHREEAVADGLTGTVFLVERIHTSWYQSGFFKWLAIIVAVVLIVLSIIFPGFLVLAANMLAFAAGAGIAATTLLAYMIYAVLAFAVGFIISFASSAIGGTLGTVFAVVAAVAFFYSAGGFSNISSSFSSLKSAPGWGTAISFINATGPIYNMGFTVVNAYTIGEYEADLRDFTKDAREKQEELEDAWDSFGPVPDWLDPMELTAMFKRAGSTEQPSSYFERVLNPNPGINSYALIEGFSDAAYMLPKAGTETITNMMIQDFEKQRG